MSFTLNKAELQKKAKVKARFFVTEIIIIKNLLTHKPSITQLIYFLFFFSWSSEINQRGLIYIQITQNTYFSVFPLASDSLAPPKMKLQFLINQVSAFMCFFAEQNMDYEP